MSAKSTVSFDRAELLTRHGLQPKEFEKTRLKWPLLEKICTHYAEAAGELHTAATYVSQRLQQVPTVHSLKTRVKHPEHLVAKIIRKKLERPRLQFSVQNYRVQITDLIGVRALHLFKDDWHPIHQFVLDTWDLQEDPIAYIRHGDPDAWIRELEGAKCKVIVHPFGYRSIHYLLKTQPEKRAYLAELQVRTVFEEGWSEIDHRVRYPRQSQDAQLGDFLAIFNRLSGSADEMGTFIRSLSRASRDQADALAERDQRLAKKEADLNSAVQALKISQREKDRLQEQIAEMRSSSQQTAAFPALGFNLGTPGPVASTLVGGLGLGLSYGVERTCMRCGKKYTEPHSMLASVASMSQCQECRNNIFILGQR